MCFADLYFVNSANKYVRHNVYGRNMDIHCIVPFNRLKRYNFPDYDTAFLANETLNTHAGNLFYFLVVYNIDR